MKVIVISTPESAPFETAPSSDILRRSATLVHNPLWPPHIIL